MQGAQPKDAAAALQWLLDERDCVNLVNRYGSLADGDDADAFAELFTADAVWERPDGTVHSGRETIRNAYATRDTGGFSQHLICNVAVTLSDARQATARSIAVVLKSAESAIPSSASPSVFMLAYEDRLTLCADDHWRIARRSSQMVLALAQAG